LFNSTLIAVIIKSKKNISELPGTVGELQKYQQQLENQLRKTERKLKKVRDDLKLLQNQLLQSEKMASLGQLTAGIAHELNNPINFINAGSFGLSQDLRDLIILLEKYEELNNQPGIVQYLEKIDKLKEKIDYDFLKKNVIQTIEDIKLGAKRTTEIVQGLRNFSRLNDTVMQMTDIHEGIDSTLVLLKNELKNKVEVKKEYDENIREILCYPGHLNQVFMNLLSNAEQSIEGKGKITIKTKNLKNKTQISIKDNGTGISEEVKNKVFEPFFTTKEPGQGTGLGLSISHDIIKRHQGSIEVKSKLGKGSEFIITLPHNEKQ